MKIITLNTWGARAGLKRLENFFSKYQDADVFCLQEIWQAHDENLIEARDPRLVPDLLEKVASWLPEFHHYFRPQYRGIFGLATFVRRSIEVLTEGELFVFKEQGFENPAAIGNHARNIQFVRVRTVGGPLTIVNFHGLWNGQGKADTEDRLLQSRKIAEFISHVDPPYVLAGDFNLRPDTESFKILTEACPRDFVTEFQVKSTRSSLYKKPEKFADYILGSRGLSARAFEVLPEEVSDHMALRVQLDL